MIYASSIFFITAATGRCCIREFQEIGLLRFSNSLLSKKRSRQLLIVMALNETQLVFFT